MNKIRKMKCSYHEDNRDISEYVFWHTDIRRHGTKKQDIDIWECKKCKERLDKAIDRERRIREHNERQRQERIFKRDAAHRKWLDKKYKSMQEDLWDETVQNELCKGLKLKGYEKKTYKDSIPKELLQLKRATMKLDRLIDKIKKGEKTKKQLEEEKIQAEIERLKYPLVNCKNHGPLFLHDVIKGGKSRWTGEQRYKCRECMSDLHQDYYERKKEYVLERQAEYRRKYPERRKEIKEKSRRKNNVFHKDNERSKSKGSESI